MSRPVFDRVPPQDLAAERSVLGAMLLNGEVIPRVLSILGETREAFYVPEHGVIYDAVVDLYRYGRPVDLITLTDHMREEGTIGKVRDCAVYLASLTDAVPTSANATYYAEIVHGLWQRRAVITACTRAAGDLYNPQSETPEALQALESTLMQVARGRFGGALNHVAERIPTVRNELQDLLDGKPMTGVKTGFRNVDRIQRPLGPGNYVLLAARPSVGKTTLACNMAANMLRAGTPVLFISLEMSAEEITKKFLSALTGVDIYGIERGYTKRAAEEQLKLRRAAEELARLPLYIDDSPEMGPIELRANIREAVKEHETGVIFIDYLGLLQKPKSESQNVAVGEISRQVKAAARESGVPIIALCQLSRAGAEVKPQIHNLRDSGTLEQDADAVWLLSRADEPGEQETIIVDIAKQRTGPTGEARLLFMKSRQQFRDLAPDGGPAPERVPSEYRETVPFDEYVGDMVEERYEEDECLI